MTYKCRDCEFHLGCNSNLIESTGPQKTKIMVVIDVPGRTDDETGELLSGDAGKKFDYLLEHLNLEREQIYVTSAIRCAPPWGKKPKKANILACSKHLMSEILSVRPKVIIAMGAVAMEALINEKGGIFDYRGEFNDLEIAYEVGGKERVFTTQVLPTHSINACLAKWESDSIVVHDLKRALAFANTGEMPKEPKLEFEIVNDLTKLEAAVDHLCSVDRLVFDLETTGLHFHKNKIIFAGFCTELGKAIIIPFHEYTDDEMKKFKPDEKAYALQLTAFVKKNRKALQQALRKIFNSPIKKIAHNGKFDITFCRANGFPVRNFWFDTIIAHSLIDENKPHGLTFCLDWFDIGYGNYEKHLWPYVNKTKGKKKPYSYVPPKILCLYLAKDVDGTFRVFRKVVKALKAEGMVDLMMKQQMPLVRLMGDLEFRGIKMDIPRLQQISKDFAKILAEIDGQIKKITKNPDFNPNSPKQLATYLQDIGALGNEGDKKTKGSNRDNISWSTDESVLARLATRKNIGRVPRLILESRTISKMKSNYLDGKDGASGILQFVDEKGFVHYSSNIHTPRTGRMSISDPACVDLKTQILTIDGWKGYKDLTLHDLVFSYNKNTEKLELQKPNSIYVSELKERDMVRVKSTHLNMVLSGNHRVLYKNRKTDEFLETSAQNFPNDCHIPQSANFSCVDLFPDADVLRLLTAIQADECFVHHKLNHFDFKFTKLRKYQRLTRILDNLGVDRWGKCTDSYYRVTFKFDFANFLGCLNSKKQFTFNLLRMSKKEKRVFSNELRLWDGASTRSNLDYFSIHRQNADVVLACLATSGHRGHRIKQYNTFAPLWHVFQSRKNFSSVSQRTLIQKYSEKCRVWCINVDNGFFLAKRGGDHFITGNCQTIPRPNPKYPQANIRQLFIPSRKDWIMFSVDFKQLEMRIAAFLSHDITMIKEIRDGVDMHSRNAVTLGKMCRMLPDDVTEKRFIEILNYKGDDPKLKQLSLEWIELRVMVKALGFGLNYGMTASTLAKDHGRDEDEMQDMIDGYFDKYSGLYAWREEQCAAVEEGGLLVLPETGRKRRGMGATAWFNSEFSQNIRMRAMDIEGVQRQFMNFPIQGLANEYFVAGKLKFYKALKKENYQSRLLLSLHDGILGEGPPSEMLRLRDLAKKCLERDLGSGKLSVPLGIDFELYDCWSGKKLDIERMG